MKAHRSKLGDKILKDKKLSVKILQRLSNGEDDFVESGIRIKQMR